MECSVSQSLDIPSLITDADRDPVACGNVAEILKVNKKHINLAEHLPYIALLFVPLVSPDMSKVNSDFYTFYIEKLRDFILSEEYFGYVKMYNNAITKFITQYANVSPREMVSHPSPLTVPLQCIRDDFPDFTEFLESPTVHHGTGCVKKVILPYHVFHLECLQISSTTTLNRALFIKTMIETLQISIS